MWSKLILVLFAIPLAGHAQTKSDMIRNEFISLVTKDLKAKGILKHDSDIVISQYAIRFELNSVSENFIASNYVPGFSFGNNTLGSKCQFLIQKAKDSLHRRSSRLNSDYLPPASIPCVSVAPTKVIIFISAVRDNKIYGDAILAAGVMCDKRQIDFFGESFSYFMAKQKDSAQFYSGSIANN